MTARIHAGAAALLLAALAGCAEVTPAPARPPSAGPAAELAQNFNAAETGTLRGRIVWEGTPANVAQFKVHPELDSHPNLPHHGVRANPHVPRVNDHNHGVAQAVVFLRQVDLRRSRPWDHDPVIVENSDWHINILQGSSISPIGFVRRGMEFQTVNRQNVLHTLRGDGAAFFSLPLADPDVVSRRVLEKTGHVELSSGADFFWMRAHLFVDDHPYYTQSDADGNFVLANVPAGSYQVVCWLPNWNVARRERNAEVGLLGRIRYCPAVEKERSVTVAAGQTGDVEFTVSEKDFVDCRRYSSR